MAVSVVAAPASGQVAAIDEGSFTLYRDGERIGREDFSIRSAPGASGRVLVAQATIASGLRRIAPGLNADTTGFPARYQCEIRDSGRVVETYSGQAARERFASRLLRADGESAREFRLPAGTVTMTVYFHADADELRAIGDDYLLGQAQAQVFHKGFFDQTAQLWSRSGHLLATSQQVMYFKD